MVDRLQETELSLDDRIAAALPTMSPAEQKIASFLRNQKEAVLLSSAAEIAEKAGTSDATVVRAARSLGFESLSGLREAILADLTGTGPERRLSHTLKDLGADPKASLDHVLNVHHDSLEALASQEFSEAFDRSIRRLYSANRRFVFGIGPSGCVADYAALQFNRLGLRTTALTASGVGLADALLALEPGDIILMFAGAPLYREIIAVLDHAETLGVPTILVSSTLGPALQKRVAEILPVPRGRADNLAMHGATIVLVEALVVALAAQDGAVALRSLQKLGRLRGAIDKLWVKRGAR